MLVSLLVRHTMYHKRHVIGTDSSNLKPSDIRRGCSYTCKSRGLAVKKIKGNDLHADRYCNSRLTSTLVKRLSSSAASGIGCLGAPRTLPLRACGPPKLPMPRLGWQDCRGVPPLMPPMNTSRTPPSPSPARLCTIPIVSPAGRPWRRLIYIYRLLPPPPRRIYRPAEQPKNIANTPRVPSRHEKRQHSCILVRRYRWMLFYSSGGITTADVDTWITGGTGARRAVQQVSSRPSRVQKLANVREPKHDWNQSTYAKPGTRCVWRSLSYSLTHQRHYTCVVSPRLAPPVPTPLQRAQLASVARELQVGS